MTYNTGFTLSTKYRLTDIFPLISDFTGLNAVGPNTSEETLYFNLFGQKFVYELTEERNNFTTGS